MANVKTETVRHEYYILLTETLSNGIHVRNMTLTESSLRHSSSGRTVMAVDDLDLCTDNYIINIICDDGMAALSGNTNDGADVPNFSTVTALTMALPFFQIYLMIQMRQKFVFLVSERSTCLLHQFLHFHITSRRAALDSL